MTYPDLCTLLGGEPSVPVFHHPDEDTVVCYLPDWTPVAVQERVQQRWRDYAAQTHPLEAIMVVLVTDVPKDRLFGDWRQQAPEARGEGSHG